MQTIGAGGPCPPSDLLLPTTMTDSLSTMTSSITSSLTSPGDSGVAMLDSEAEITSASEDVLEIPTPTEEIRPASPPFKLGHMTNSDIANGNTKLPEITGPSEVVVLRRAKSNRISSSNHSEAAKQQKRVSFHEELIQPDHEIAGSENTGPESDSNQDLLSRCAETSITCERKSQPSRDSLYETYSAETSSTPNYKDMSDLVKSLDCQLSVRSDLCDGSEGETSSSDVRRSKHVSVGGNRGLRDAIGPRYRGRDQSAAGVLSAVRSLIAGSPSAAARSIGSMPVAERGAPEGVEDPPLSASTLDLYHHVDVAERLRDGEPLKHSSADSDSGSGYAQPASPRRFPASPSRSPHLRQTNPRRYSGNSSNSSVLREAPSKSCLVNRFLRSLTEKKLQSTRSVALSSNSSRRSAQRPPRKSLYIRGARPVDELSKEILDELEEEIRTAPPSIQNCNMELAISPAIRERLLADVLTTRIENPCKIYRVRVFSPKSSPEAMLAVLTERAMYLIDHLWQARNIMLLAHLDSILLGPGSQWVKLFSKEGTPKMQKPTLKEMTLILGDESSTRQLLSSIELAVRRLSLPGRRIPAVHRFPLEDLSSSPAWSAVVLGETVYHSAVVHAADICPSPPSTPLGPSRRGYFMFSHVNGHSHVWTAGFFVLKAGVLYQFASEDKQIPILSLPLTNLQPRPASHARPHTIQAGHLLLAAPDQGTASDWLRAVSRAASGEESGCSIEDPEPLLRVATLILTEERLVLLAGLESSAPVLLVAHLNDLVSVQFGDSEESWCVLDLACREASESVGDFVVYFATCSEMQSFKDSMCRLKPDFEQIWTTIPLSSPLRPRCQKMQSVLFSSWSIFLSSVGRESCDG